MSALWSSAEIAAATGGVEHGAFAVDAVSFDSREVIGGELFVAMTGESEDGHRFVDDAQARGAGGFLVGRPVPYPHVLVEDGLTGLEALAAASRERSDALRIGVTGSVGKTSVKEALRRALQEVEPEATHWSVKSYNNHTGVPLSLARMPRDTRYAVFEMGMNHAGELAALTRLVRPHIAVVTWVAPAHREFFESEAAIADAKAEIFEGLEPGGTAIVPFDNPHVGRLIAKAKRHAERIVSFGSADGADVRVRSTAADARGTTVIADVAGHRCGYHLPVPGAHWVQNSLAVMACAHAAGVDLAAAGLGLGQIRGLEGRGAQHQVPAGAGEATLIDESYNANPASMAAALRVLGEREPGAHGRRIAVLGEMRELGTASAAFHAGLAPAIDEAKVSHVILVGEATTPLARALANHVQVIRAADADAALAALDGELAAGDVVLVKGSNGVGLGRLVGALRERTR